ncbi:MAG TPA: glycosyltransferase [Allosphingosinicella sp.]|nr:glycosyltransferase [Allosphingosinicella sp.]
MPRLAVVVSHPIQHFAAFYRAMARSGAVDLHVFFGARIGLDPYFDKGLNTTVSWNTDLLSGYAHSFLPKAGSVKRRTPWALNDPALAGQLSDFAPDAVLIYGYNSINALRALRWCRRNGVPALMIADSEDRQRRVWWKRLFKKIGLRRLLSAFDGFLTVGDANEAYYRRYGVTDDRMFRSPFTIDEDVFRKAIEKREQYRTSFRHKHGIPEDAFVALFVGKLSERKRPGDLIKAVAHLSGDTRVHAALAGNGVLRDDLERQAQGLPVTFLGFVNVDELPLAYLAADVLVHTSSIDPHPLVCSEAAICGLPMILSDRVGAAGPTDVARPGENALIYPCGNASELAEQMRRISSDPDLHRMMAGASARIFSDVDVRASVDGVVRALAAVIGHRTSRAEASGARQRAA